MKRVLDQALLISICLYTVSILSTMAGMEIFGWLSALLTLALLAMGHLKMPPILKGDWALVALCGVGAIGALINTPEPKSVIDIVGLFRFAPLFLLLRAALLYLWSEKSRAWFGVLALAAGVLGLYAVSQYFTGFDILRWPSHRAVQIFAVDGQNQPTAFRASGLLSSPITYAYSFGLFLCFPLAYFLVMGRADRWQKWMGACAFILLLSLVASMTRGAWVAMVAAAWLMTFYMGRRYALVSVAAVVVLIGLAMGLSHTFSERVTSIVTQSKSRADRELIWAANFAMFKDYPVLGVGYGENERLIENYYHRLGLDGQVGHAHNTYMQFLSGTGVLGLALYLFFIGFYLWLCHQLWFALPENAKWLRVVVLGAIGAQMVLHIGGLTECNFKDTEVTHEFMLVVALVGVVNQLVKGEYGSRSPRAIKAEA